MSMDQNNGPHSSPPPMQPDRNPIKKEDVLTQFAVIRTKDGRVAVQFPVLDVATSTVDIPMAMELCGAGLQTLAQIVRQQQTSQVAPRIAVVPAIPKEFLTKPQ
jgi:hypothetical protein